MFRYGMQEQIIPLISPVDITNTDVNSPFVKVSNAHWLRFLVPFGTITGDTCTVTVAESTANSTSGGATEVAVPFTYRLSGAVGVDTWGAVTTADSGGLLVTASDDDKILAIDIDPRTLDDGYNYVRVQLVTGGSMSACEVAAVAIVHPRYAQLDNVSST